MQRITLIITFCFLVLSVAACQSNKPRTMWDPNVDTSLKVPPVNTGGTSKTAPYAHCNYGEDCGKPVQKSAPKASTQPTDEGTRRITISDGETTRSMTITSDGAGGGSIVFSSDDE